MTDHTLPSNARRTLHKVDLTRDGEYKEGTEGREVVTDLSEANVVSSLAPDFPTVVSPWHRPVLDLDIPAFLVPSSTPGHSHLYLDVKMDDAIFWRLLEVLADAGVLEPGYVRACKSRGYTSVRLPWIKKAEATA